MVTMSPSWSTITLRPKKKTDTGTIKTLEIINDVPSMSVGQLLHSK